MSIAFPISLKTKNKINVSINNFKDDFINGIKFSVTSHVKVSFQGLEFKVHAEHSEDSELSISDVTLDDLITAIEQCESLAELEAVVFLARRGIKKGDLLNVTEDNGKQYKAVVVGHWGSIARISKITKSGRPSKMSQCLYSDFKYEVIS